jgi:16S rRNA (cytosine1402-N4)-methyltransferase
VSARHEPVLLAESLGFLRNGPGLYLDATLGDGGHAEALLASEPGARLLGTDRDPASLAFARARLAPFETRVVIAQAAFHELPPVHARLGAEPFTGVMLDLGLSSRQIDDPARGISFMSDGPLDLRLDPGRGAPVAERLAEVEPDALAAVLREHGDVPMAGRLARAIVAAARAGELGGTRALVALVERVSGGYAHPRRLAQVFQALRIWVNDEAHDLETMMDWLPGVVRSGGVVVTLAYHSGEDRRIKQALRGRPETVPARRLPPGPQRRPAAGPWQELTRRGVVASDLERAANPRARSARLRAFRRTTA